MLNNDNVKVTHTQLLSALNRIEFSHCKFCVCVRAIKARYVMQGDKSEFVQYPDSIVGGGMSSSMSVLLSCVPYLVIHIFVFLPSLHYCSSLENL